MLKMCLNPKVLLGLAAVGVAIWLLAPGALTAALPLLVLAACPLSMLLMMAMMRGHNGTKEGARAAETSEHDIRAELAGLQARRQSQLLDQPDGTTEDAAVS